MRERRQGLWMVLLAIVLTVGLAACGTAGPGGGGGDDGGDDPGGGDGPGETASTGMVVVDENDFMGSTSYEFSAMFLEGSGFLPSDIEGVLGSFIGTCYVDTDEDLPDVPSDPTEPPSGGGTSMTFLSVGDEVTFEAGGTAFLTLDKFVPEVDIGFDFIVYEMPEDTTIDSVPTDLTVSAPGDAFPAFSGVAMPRASIPSSPTLGATVDGSTTFTWTPDSAGAYRLLNVDVEGTGAHEGTRVDCLLDDADGSFSFASVADLPAGFTGEVTGVSRDAFNFETVAGDARLMLLASGSQFSFDVLDRLERRLR